MHRSRAFAGTSCSTRRSWDSWPARGRGHRPAASLPSRCSTWSRSATARRRSRNWKITAPPASERPGGGCPAGPRGQRCPGSDIRRRTSLGSASGHHSKVSPAGPGATTAEACRRTQGTQAEGRRAWAAFAPVGDDLASRDLLAGARAQIQQVVVDRQDLSCRRVVIRPDVAGHRLLARFDESDSLDQLGGLVAVLRRRNQPQGRAVLVCITPGSAISSRDMYSYRLSAQSMRTGTSPWRAA